MAEHARSTVGHTHAHAHDDVEPPVTIRGRKALIGVVVAIVVATLAGLALLWPPSDVGEDNELLTRGDRVRGAVAQMAEVGCTDSEVGGDTGEPAPGFEQARRCLAIRVLITDGPDKGKTVDLRTGEEPGIKPGRGVVLVRGNDELPIEERYQYADVQRGRQLFALAGLFVVAVVALGRRRGALALLGLGLSAIVLVKFLVPALLAGSPPLAVALVGASAVMILVLGLAHGPSIRTATAMVGTAASLLLIVALSLAFVALTGLSGLTSDDDYFVQSFFGAQVDLRGLLLAGIVIGALGILDDVTVTQVSIVWELRAADPDMSSTELYAAALRVGRDHIASTVNTLLLAYAGASLPLLVIFTTAQQGLIDTVTTDVVAQEVVRTLVGSIGLVAAVPLTTALATVMAGSPRRAAAAVPAAAPAMPLDETIDEDDPHSWGPRAAGDPEDEETRR